MHSPCAIKPLILGDAEREVVAGGWGGSAALGEGMGAGATTRQRVLADAHAHRVCNSLCEARGGCGEGGVRDSRRIATSARTANATTTATAATNTAVDATASAARRSSSTTAAASIPKGAACSQRIQDSYCDSGEFSEFGRA